jgi:hypothetical protein
MARFSIRKLGSAGDTCTAVTEAELEGHLRQELGQGFSAAVRADDGTSAFVGKDIGRTMAAVEQIVADGAEDVEVLLIPPVAGGQLSPPLSRVRNAMKRTKTLHLAFAPEEVDYDTAEGIDFQEIYRKILEVFSIAEDEFLPIYPSFNFDDFVKLVDDFIERGGELKIYLHDFGTRVERDTVNFDRLRKEGPKFLEFPQYYCALIGTLSAGANRSYILNGRIRLDNREVLEKWLKACVLHMWAEPAPTQALAEKLAEAVIEYVREADRRSLETLRLTLGNEVAEQLQMEGCVLIKSSDGKEYVINATGEVFDMLGQQHCVQVENEGELPRYDRVLAKYLVIRDHPEQIDTLNGALGHCTRCGMGIRLGDIHAAVTLDKQAFERGQEGRGHEIDVLEADALCWLCSGCYKELSSAGAFNKIVPLLTARGSSEPAAREAITYIYQCKCPRCNLHFVVYSWFADKAWKCPECGGENLQAMPHPSGKQVCELFADAARCAPGRGAADGG